ncbi:MAG: ABC transporter permease [bacterium]
MIQWIKIAFRNILKNKRRSLVTLLAIAMGFAAVSLFQGYTNNIYKELRISAVSEEGLGHLTIYKKGWSEKGKIEPDLYMFSKQEVRRIIELAKEEPEVILATPQIHISGLASNGRISTIFIATGVVADDDRIIKGDRIESLPIKGDFLNDRDYYGVEMSEELAKMLSLKVGSDAVVMATTLDGQMNALNIQVSGIYNTGTEATNDKYIRFLLPLAQSLYDTEKADQIVVLLNDWKKTDQVRISLLRRLSEAGISCEIKTWNELSSYYRQVKQMFDMIFMFIYCIVLIIVIMSVINTMGTAVLERTREIGTLRALGIKQRGVNLLFAIEGAMLGFWGSIAGIVLNIAIWGFILMIKPTYIPPGLSSPVPLVINLVPSFLFSLMVFLILLSLLAAILPARRAARLKVVDALGHV